MLYGKDYDNLFAGEVNTEPSDFEEEEKKMEEKKTIKERWNEFSEEHPVLSSVIVGAVIGIPIFLIARSRANRATGTAYLKGLKDGWKMCADSANNMYNHMIAENTAQIVETVTKAS